MARMVHEKSDVIPLLAEVFRELGFDGASLGQITGRTGVAKGSLYHFFPEGKEQMAAEVLAHVDQWFAENVFAPLEHDDPLPAIEQMWSSVDAYFGSGRRVCLVGAFALDATRDRFASEIGLYFERWIDALAGGLRRAGVARSEARAQAERVVVGIQGALVLARALDDDGIFNRSLCSLKDAIDGLVNNEKSRPPVRAGKAPAKRKRA